MSIGLRVFLLTVFVALGFALPHAAEVQAAEKRVTQKSRAKPVASKATKGKAAKKQVLAKGEVKSKARRKSLAASGAVAASGVLAVQSGSALVVDQFDGEALFQKNASQIVPIASITKLMSAMVVLVGSPASEEPVRTSADAFGYLRRSG